MVGGQLLVSSLLLLLLLLQLAGTVVSGGLQPVQLVLELVRHGNGRSDADCPVEPERTFCCLEAYNAVPVIRNRTEGLATGEPRYIIYMCPRGRGGL